MIAVTFITYPLNASTGLSHGYAIILFAKNYDVLTTSRGRASFVISQTGARVLNSAPSINTLNIRKIQIIPTSDKYNPTHLKIQCSSYDVRRIAGHVSIVEQVLLDIGVTGYQCYDPGYGAIHIRFSDDKNASIAKIFLYRLTRAGVTFVSQYAFANAGTLSDVQSSIDEAPLSSASNSPRALSSSPPRILTPSPPCTLAPSPPRILASSPPPSIVTSPTRIVSQPPLLVPSLALPHAWLLPPSPTPDNSGSAFTSFEMSILTMAIPEDASHMPYSVSFYKPQVHPCLNIQTSPLWSNICEPRWQSKTR